MVEFSLPRASDRATSGVRAAGQRHRRTSVCASCHADPHCGESKSLSDLVSHPRATRHLSRLKRQNRFLENAGPAGALFVERAGNACSRSARWACDRSRRGANEESPGRSNGWRISVLLTKRGRRCRGGALLPNCPDWRGGPYAPDHRAQWLPAKVRATAHWLDDGTDCVRRWSSTARVQSDIVRRISFSNVPFRFCS